MTKEKGNIKLQMIKTDKCYYIKMIDGINRHLTSVLINGETPVKTNDRVWFMVKSEPVEATIKLPLLKTNPRMVLKSEVLEKDGFSGSTLGKMRPEIPRDECMYEDDYEWEWKSEFSHLASLYELKFDTEQPEPESLNLECELFCEIPDLEAYTGMDYLAGERYSCYENKKIKETVTEGAIRHRAIDRIIYPSVALPSCHAIMGSDDFYRIIRFHIKQHIDYRFAEITSDYDFCFMVKKRVIKNCDYEIVSKLPANQKPLRVKADSVAIFEMTPLSKKYRDYTVLPAIEAKNNKALKRKIDKYLRDLMKDINAPIVKCSHCNGTGAELKGE